MTLRHYTHHQAFRGCTTAETQCAEEEVATKTFFAVTGGSSKVVCRACSRTILLFYSINISSRRYLTFSQDQNINAGNQAFIQCR